MHDLTTKIRPRLRTMLYHVLGLLVTTGCFTGNALALGVLDPQLNSYLNEPLEIEIPIMLTRQEQNANITIQQVQNINPNIAEWVPALKFELLSHSDGHYSILARTEESVVEPIVHFTLSIDTGFHWVKRDMSFLLDPKPIQVLTQQRLKPVQPKVVLKPSEARPAPAQASRPTIATPRVEVTAEDGNRYTVQNGDSLSLIAARFNDSRNATLHQAMVAIFSSNQRAFINNDVNKIMSHFEIVIPDEQQMTQLSAPEARQVFGELMSGAEVRYVQVAPPAAAPAQAPATETTATPPRPPAPMPKTEPVPIPETLAEQPAAEQPPAPAPAPAPVAEPRPEQTSADKAFELTLSNEDKALSQNIIEKNEGTLVFETPEAAAVKAASPSPEVKAAMQSAVNDMEAQLSTLRDEVKKLRQTLQGKERLLALRSETRLHTQEAEAAATTGPEPAAAEAETPAVSKPGPVELETTTGEKTDEGFDFVRLLIEVLTLGAAGAFIGYFLAYRRKQQTGEEAVAEEPDSSSLRSMFSRKSTEEEEYEEEYEEEEEEPEPEPRPRHILEEDGRKQEIQVIEEAYDDSIDFTHTEVPQGSAMPNADAEEPQSEDANPDYVLQEANLSIAFGDLNAAYEALFKLVNRYPQNSAYRLAMLRALKGLSREEEFIYHANHLAKLTDQAPDTEWRQALEWGHEFLPDHPLFQSWETSAEQTAPSADTERKTLDDASAKAHSTVVMDTRKALAEYEQKLREHEQAKLSGRLLAAGKPTEDDDDDLDKTQAREIISLDLGEDAAQVNSPFKLDLNHTHDEAQTDDTADFVDDDKTRSVYEEAKSSASVHEEELTTMVHDHAPEVAENNMLDLDELMDDDAAASVTDGQEAEPQHSAQELSEKDAAHIIEFDSEASTPLLEPHPTPPESTQSAAAEPGTQKPAQGTLDGISPDTLASMMEFGLVEGIDINEEVLKRLHEAEQGEKSPEEPDDSNDTDDTVLLKRD